MRQQRKCKMAYRLKCLIILMLATATGCSGKHEEVRLWLKPVKYYKGAAWYQREVDIPQEWAEKRVILFLERCHWESTLFVNGSSAGSQNSLAAPHEYDITDLVKPGKNLISIRIDNRVIVSGSEKIRHGDRSADC